MPSDFVTRSLGHATEHVPGLRRIPVVRLLAIAEMGLIARDHVLRLSPEERRRLFRLIRSARGRPSHLSRRERVELVGLVAKLEPRWLAGEAVERLSPIPLPRRLVRGRRKR
ncbi:MAG: hypothetical protein ABI323_13760 [Solirubrobacteraceae bacterium]